MITPGESASHADCAVEYVKCCEEHLFAVVPTAKNPRTFEGAPTANPPVAFWQKVSVFSCPSDPAASVNEVTLPLKVMRLALFAVERVGVAENVTVSELAIVDCATPPELQTSAT